MKKQILITVILVSLASGGIFISSLGAGTNHHGFVNPLTPSTQIMEKPVKWDTVYGKVPLYFIPNRGQMDEKAKYYAVTPRYTLWMTEDGLVFDSVKPVRENNNVNHNNSRQPGGEKIETPLHVTRNVSSLEFLGANKNTAITPVDIAKHRVNYYKGNQSGDWKTNIPTSKAVLYTNVYTKTDLKVYGIENRIEYDWVLKKGANPSEIRWKYKNVNATGIDEEGNLVVETGFGRLIHQKPFSYQIIDGKKQEIASGFKSYGENVYGFETGKYNLRYDLIIDPEVKVDFSTYIGGEDYDMCAGMKVNADGEMYLTGYSFSYNFPTKNAYQGDNAGSGDMVIVKLSADGNELLYSTYLGGTGTDTGKALSLNYNDEAFVVGNTTSTDFPTLGQGKGSYEVVALLLNDDGSLKWAKLISGSDYDSGWACDSDSSGNFYFVGHTFSIDFPTVNPYQPNLAGGSDAFFCIVNSAGDFTYSTYFGGTAHDGAQAIAVNTYGVIAITGFTRSINFPTKKPIQSTHGGGTHDGFICTFSPLGASLNYSTYLGGADLDNLWGIAIDKNGCVYTSGGSYSKNFPVKNAYQSSHGGGDSDVVFSKLAAGGGSILFSSYLGGSGSDDFADIVVDNAQNFYLLFNTGSNGDLPVKNAYQDNLAGEEDVGIAKFASNGTDLLFLSYLGGKGMDQRGRLALDNAGNIYIGGKTASTDFPVVNAFQGTHGSGVYDMFATRMVFTYDLTVQSTPESGASITVSPADISGKTTGNTDFTRSYAPGSNVTLTAPSSFNGSNFQKWTVDGKDQSGRTIQVKMDSNHTASALFWDPPQIQLNRTKLNFGYVINGMATGPQTLMVSNAGKGTLSWAITSTVPWLTVSPASGTNSGQVTVSVNTSGLSAGTYSGVLAVTDSNAVNSPQLVAVTLRIYSSGSPTPSDKPFGVFETPAENASVYGSVPFTGWVLDDIETEWVKIYRKEGDNFLYVGEAVFVDGARPDVEKAYPTYPKNYNAGWGYMMLTNFLPNGGNGSYTFSAIAQDKSGNQTILGTRTINCDNAHSAKPFGAIDTPEQGGTASGSSFVNFGWALTPTPNYIPIDGSTINVWIDGVSVGKPVYNILRDDIAALFPGYMNSQGASGYYYFDTRTFDNGVHTIQWTVTDSAGNAEGIGSRYFTIYNNSQLIEDESAGTDSRENPVSALPASSRPVNVRTGFDKTKRFQPVSPDKKGNIHVETRELQRIEINMGGEVDIVSVKPVGMLPIGSVMDTKKGVFCWMPGPGFIGKYSFEFIETDRGGKEYKRTVDIRILPRFGK